MHEEMKKYITILTESEDKNKEKIRIKFANEFEPLYNKMKVFLDKIKEQGVSKSRFNNVEEMIDNLESMLVAFREELNHNVDFFAESVSKNNR